MIIKILGKPFAKSNLSRLEVMQGLKKLYKRQLEIYAIRQVSEFFRPIIQRFLNKSENLQKRR